MKLTKKQVSELVNCHNGVGYLVVKGSENLLSAVQFFVGKNKEICIINDNIPSNKINLNEFVLEHYKDEE